MSTIQFPHVLGTTNAGKAREWEEILSSLMGAGAPLIDILKNKIPSIEIQDIDPVVVAITKAFATTCFYGKPILVEDVSFGLPELNGFPGALYAPTEKALGLQGILHLVADTKNRRATVTETIAFTDVGCTEVYVVKAQLDGVIPEKPRGDNGFGFDPIFIPNGFSVTLAEMTSVQKNDCSMRRLGIDKLLKGEWETYNLGQSPLSGLLR